MQLKICKINIFFWELVGTLALHAGELVIRFPCNHADRLAFSYKDCMAALALFEIVNALVKKEICVLFWVLFVLAFIIPTIEDKCNILVSYEVWTERGMPDWGQMSSVSTRGE